MHYLYLYIFLSYVYMNLNMYDQNCWFLICLEFQLLKMCVVYIKKKFFLDSKITELFSRKSLISFLLKLLIINYFQVALRICKLH